MSAALQQAMLEYGQAIRGDWSDFDGGNEQAVITGWVAEMRNPNPVHDLLWHRRDLGICEAGGAGTATAMRSAAAPAWRWRRERRRLDR